MEQSRIFLAETILDHLASSQLADARTSPAEPDYGFVSSNA